MDFAKMGKMSGRPPLFTPGTHQMWSDPHISRFMLEAHLDPDLEAASRTHDTIQASLWWLEEEILPSPPARILDLGCGPGLYSLPLAQKGYEVLGMDISRRSLDYAREQARREKNLNLEYREMDYRELNWENYFDAILLIYCDLGALLKEDRDRVLKGIYRALRPGGIFVFDVFTPARRGREAEGRDWEVTQSGFWSPVPHLVLSETFFYPEENVFLEQHLVLEEGGEVKNYRIWDHVYTRDSVMALLEANEFKGVNFFSDVTGGEYSSESETIAVVARK